MSIDITAPRLSWQMQSDQRGAWQTAYHIRAASDPHQLRKGKANRLFSFDSAFYKKTLNSCDQTAP